MTPAAIPRPIAGPQPPFQAFASVGAARRPAVRVSAASVPAASLVNLVMAVPSQYFDVGPAGRSSPLVARPRGLVHGIRKESIRLEFQWLEAAAGASRACRRA